MKSLIPRRKQEDEWRPAVRGDNPFTALHQQVDQLFNEFFESLPGYRGHGWPELPGYEMAGPQIEVHETDKAITVKAELPGMDDKDIEVLLDNNMLTIRGEKKEEKREEKENYLVSEVRYGTFSRTLPVPPGIDRDKVTSTFKKGVLRLTLPKSKEAQEHRKRIKIETAD